MHLRIKGFSFIELTLCLLILSVGLLGFLTLQRHSLQILNQVQTSFDQYMQRMHCFELELPLGSQCDHS